MHTFVKSALLQISQQTLTQESMRQIQTRLRVPVGAEQIPSGLVLV